MRSNRLMGLVLGFGICGVFPIARVHAAPMDFDFKDPKSVNSIVFVLDSLIEPIVGLASGTSGTVSFDPEQPKSLKGTLTIDAASLHTANKGMKDTLHNSEWLDVKKHPKIEFKIKEVKESKKEKDTFELQVVGDMTCRGVTKAITVPVKVNYLPGKLSNRQRGTEGDLLILRSDFSITRKDFGIKPDMGPDVVAEEIQIKVSIAGGSPKK
ncbi:MAG: YceI family protein [Planctomycetota bacterium]